MLVTNTEINKAYLPSKNLVSLGSGRRNQWQLEQQEGNINLGIILFSSQILTYVKETRWFYILISICQSPKLIFFYLSTYKCYVYLVYYSRHFWCNRQKVNFNKLKPKQSFKNPSTEWTDLDRGASRSQNACLHPKRCEGEFLASAISAMWHHRLYSRLVPCGKKHGWRQCIASMFVP